MRRPRAGADGADGEGPDEVLGCDGLRPSDVLSSNPAISSSPVENGRWKTVPGGCTVMLVMAGRRLRGRYAVVTDVSTGPGASVRAPSPAGFGPASPLRLAFHCR